MKFIAYYTNGYYERVYSTYLKPSCEKVGLEIHCFKERNLHDWGLNTRLKATVLLKALDTFSEDIVYIDSDATLLKYPTLFETIDPSYDLAIHYFDWWRHWRGIEGMKERELYNAVIMLRNNDKIRSFLNMWIKENTTTQCFEQKVMDKVLQKCPNIKVFDLPIEYACVSTREGTCPEYIKDPVIFQNQISREIRKNKDLLAL